MSTISRNISILAVLASMAVGVNAYGQEANPATAGTEIVPAQPVAETAPAAAQPVAETAPTAAQPVAETAPAAPSTAQKVTIQTPNGNMACDFINNQYTNCAPIVIQQPAAQPTVVYAQPAAQPTVVYAQPAPQPTVVYAQPAAEPYNPFAHPMVVFGVNLGYYCFIFDGDPIFHNPYGGIEFGVRWNYTGLYLQLDVGGGVKDDEAIHLMYGNNPEDYQKALFDEIDITDVFVSFHFMPKVHFGNGRFSGGFGAGVGVTWAQYKIEYPDFMDNDKSKYDDALFSVKFMLEMTYQVATSTEIEIAFNYMLLDAEDSDLGADEPVHSVGFSLGLNFEFQM